MEYRLLGRPGLTAAIVGPESPEEIDDNLGAVGWSLDEDARRRLDDVSTWAVKA